MLQDEGDRWIRRYTSSRFMEPQEGYSVEDWGNGVHLFRWHKGFYLSAFVVTDDGVVAIDPIDREAARAYRSAIATVTSAPVTAIVYSHDHRDHIVGASELSPSCEVIAHAKTKERILARGDNDIRVPTRVVTGGDVLAYGRHRIQVHHFGANHSQSNLLIMLPAARGRILMWVDGVEPGVAPYRELPDTDFAGYLLSLKRADELSFDFVMGGHCGPDHRGWVKETSRYLETLLSATREEFAKSGGQSPLPGEDGVEMTERWRRAICDAGAQRVIANASFATWRGTRQWAPRTADRILSFLITGN